MLDLGCFRSYFFVGLCDEAAISVRDARPAHYSFKIESFSGLVDMLAVTGEEKYESCDFEVDGYKWRLALYPSGDKKRNGTGHISLYLVFSEKNVHPLSLEVNAFFRLFVYDQINDKYITVQDVNQKVVRFHAMKTESGFSQFIPLTNFYNATNGYLVGDCCIFGAEVFVTSCTGKGEVVSVSKNLPSIIPLKINNYSKLDDGVITSDTFTLGGHTWYIGIYPNGFGKPTGKYLSLFLYMKNNIGLSAGEKIRCAFSLRLKDQIKGEHYERNASNTFTAASSSGWGFQNFLLLTDLKDKSQGFLVDDILILEAQITVLSKVTVL